MASHYCGISVHFIHTEEGAKKIEKDLQPALNAHPGVQSTLLVEVMPIWGDATLQLRIDFESPEARNGFALLDWKIPGITMEALLDAGFIAETQADYGPYWKRLSPTGPTLQL